MSRINQFNPGFPRQQSSQLLPHPDSHNPQDERLDQASLLQAVYFQRPATQSLVPMASSANPSPVSLLQVMNGSSSAVTSGSTSSTYNMGTPSPAAWQMSPINPSGSIPYPPPILLEEEIKHFLEKVLENEDQTFLKDAYETKNRDIIRKDLITFFREYTNHQVLFAKYNTELDLNKNVASLVQVMLKEMPKEIVKMLQELDLKFDISEFKIFMDKLIEDSVSHSKKYDLKYTSNDRKYVCPFLKQRIWFVLEIQRINKIREKMSLTNLRANRTPLVDAEPQFFQTTVPTNITNNASRNLASSSFASLSSPISQQVNSTLINDKRSRNPRNIAQYAAIKILEELSKDLLPKPLDNSKRTSGMHIGRKLTSMLFVKYKAMLNNDHLDPSIFTFKICCENTFREIFQQLVSSLNDVVLSGTNLEIRLNLFICCTERTLGLYAHDYLKFKFDVAFFNLLKRLQINQDFKKTLNSIFCNVIRENPLLRAPDIDTCLQNAIRKLSKGAGF